MEWLKGKENLGQLVKKYRYVLLVLLAGIFLMTLPESGEAVPAPEQPAAPASVTLEQRLSQLLEQMEGAGKVQVLLTEKAGEEIRYQTNEDFSSDANGKQQRRETVLYSGSSRQEQGLIRQVIPASYQGAVILCQGADSPQVRLAVVEAVMGVTGLGSDCITVLKMK